MTHEELTRTNRAIDAELSITSEQLRAMKPAERRMRAARLEDLFTYRARLFRTTGIDRMAEFVPPTELELVSTALARAIDKDEDSAKFWRKEASSR